MGTLRRESIQAMAQTAEWLTIARADTEFMGAVTPEAHDLSLGFNPQSLRATGRYNRIGARAAMGALFDQAMQQVDGVGELEWPQPELEVL